MGITSPLVPVCSITLGTQDVTPLEMTRAYATLANRGTVREPTPVAKVTFPDGRTREIRPEHHRALRQNDADLVSYALQRVVMYGTGQAAALADRPVAGKTGTGQNFTNAWFCGYIPQLAVCVWVGYPQGSVPLENVEGVAQVFGGSIPAEIWHDFMQTATDGMKVVDFAEPDTNGYDLGPGDYSAG
jgi:penicillin-binding protein 1A